MAVKDGSLQIQTTCAVVAVYFLIVLGGLVASTGSGLAWLIGRYDRSIIQTAYTTKEINVR